ncbi:MAG: deoxyribonuclease IV [Clostridia bacterium]|nr:deoxyribonuclease IV [Clostridia bacterium]
MFRIGCQISSARGYLAMGREAVKIGANTFQFFTRNPRGGRVKALDRADLDAYLEFAAEHGLADLLAHAPYTLNPCSAKEEVREFALQVLREDLERLALLPGTMYNFHPGSHTGQGTAVGTAQIAAALNSVLSEGQTTIVLLETMAGKGTEIGSSFAELAAIIAQVEQADLLGVCLDTCHVHEAGYDICANLDAVLGEFDRTVGLERLRAVHLNDSRNPAGARKDRHEKIGQGQIGLEAIAHVINHPALRDLPFFLETPNDAAGYAEEIRMLRELYEPQPGREDQL